MAQEREATGGKPSRQARAGDFPHDRFDDVPRSGRAGAHRVTPHQRFGWQYFIAVIIGIAVLTTAGIFAVNLLNESGRLPELPNGGQEGTKEPRVTPEIDPEATVVILDGTSATGDLAIALDPIFAERQLGTVIGAVPAESDEVEISAVFYANPEDEAAALGLAQELGGLSAYPSTDYEAYGARLIVLLGADYAGPGR